MPARIIHNPKARKYIYGIIVAAIPVLVAVGFIAEDQAQLWLTFAAAVLGLGSAGLAAPNTPGKPKQDPEPETSPGPEDGDGLLGA